MLDDAFQHRARSARRRSRARQRRSVDGRRRAASRRARGASRSSAVRRATLVIVTRKARERRSASTTFTRRSGAVAPRCRACPCDSRSASSCAPMRCSASAPLDVACGARRYRRSLRSPIRRRSSRSCARWERLSRHRLFPDHHAFTRRRNRRRRGEIRSIDHVVCTLKDAVKLGPAAGLALRRRCGMFLSR